MNPGDYYLLLTAVFGFPLLGVIVWLHFHDKNKTQGKK